jgi:semaphorin 5
MQIDGGWSEWNEWSTCSALCDGGFRIRERKCNNPAPQNDGLECIGCHVEFEECNKQACNEVKKLTSWTNWLVSNNSESGQYFEKRYRYMCKAPISDPASLKISLYKEETRACNAGDPKCRRVNVTCEAAAVCDRKGFFCV